MSEGGPAHALVVDGRRHLLRPGQTMLGGAGTNCVDDPELRAVPTAAVITVTGGGVPTIHRISAAVLVRLDDVVVAATPVEIRDGARIQVREVVARFERGEAAAHALGAPTRLGLAAPAIADARLVHVGAGRVVPLTGARVTIGRDAGCDIRLDASGVSRVHATITREADGWLLTDQSSNGTLVNGELVRGARTLRHGDVVRLHSEQLRFEVVAGAAEAKKAPAATMMVAAGSPLDELRGSSPEPRRAKRTPALATLEIANGKLAGARFALDRAVTSIGRSEQSDVRIADESVSSAHATLLLKGDAWFITDLRSANGTFVDGYRVAAEREIAPGSRIRLGRVELVFRVEAESEPRASHGTRLVKGLVERLRRGRGDG